MLRRLVVLLVLANLLFFSWTRGWLDDLTGLRAHPDREPERLARQVRPELVVLLPPDAASAVPAPSSTPPFPLTPLTPPASPTPAASGLQSAVAPAAMTACLEAGPFATGASVSAIATLQSVQPPLPPGSWADVKVERPGSWMIYMGRFPNREALAKKEEELKRTRVNYEVVNAAPELQPGLSLGRHDQRAAAERALEQLTQRGVRTARVVELAAPATLHMLRAERADPALAAQLAALRSDALGRGFVACAN